jgi:hypothetical protein
VKAQPLALLCEQLRDPRFHEHASPLGEAPLVATVFDDAHDEQDLAALSALATLPAASVARLAPDATPAARRRAALFDVVVATERELDAVATAVRRAPIAAATLVQLLRGAETRSIEDGLVAESLAYGTLQAGREHHAWLAARSAPTPVADAGAPVAVRRDGDALHVTLARPAKRNAYSAAMRDALVEALALAAFDSSITRVVLDAEGTSFCAGGDLAEFGTAPDPATAHAVRTTRSAARLLAGLAERTQVRVQGACVGAGSELAAFAGRVVAKPDAWFALPELAMGLVPGAGGTVSLPRRIGRQRTAWLALTGERLDAEHALAWGLIDAIG